MSLAKMASMDPVVGAQYRWTTAFAPKWNKFFRSYAGVDHCVCVDMLLHIESSTGLQYRGQSCFFQQRKLCTTAMAYHDDHVGRDCHSLRWEFLAPTIHQHLGDGWRRMPHHFLLRQYSHIGSYGEEKLRRLRVYHLDTRC